MATEFIGIVVGDSAYEVAVKDGFTGTQTEWLASLKGPAGVGEDGKAATVEIGTVSTLPAGSQATVENVGTAVDAVLNFAIPQGVKGADGSGSGGGIEEAPEDGKQYARQDAAWVEVEASGTYDDTGIKADITSLQNNKADKTAIPDVSDFVTDTELQALNVTLTASIATKQPTGDYATNTALTQGLATKQPVGEYALESDIPTVPTVLPNPNPIVINGTSYDGSEAVTLNIESGGGGEGGGASLATNAEWDAGISTDKAPTVRQVNYSLKDLDDKLSILNSRYDPLINSSITVDGQYELLNDYTNYEILFLRSSTTFQQIMSVSIPYVNNFAQHTLIPSMTTETADYKVTTGYPTYNNVSPYSCFNTAYSYNSTAVAKGFISATKVGNFVTIQNKNNKITTNMFSFVFNRMSVSLIYIPLQMEILGSDDGETWTSIKVVDNLPTKYDVVGSVVLDDYVSYYYYKFLVTGANAQAYVAFPQILIQDTRIHNHWQSTTTYGVSDILYIEDIKVEFVENNKVIINNLVGRKIDAIDGMLFNKTTFSPVGSMLGWELSTLPTGYLWCDGNAVPAEYPKLQALMANTPVKEGFIIQAV